jgi:hypothetical protein
MIIEVYEKHALLSSKYQSNLAKLLPNFSPCCRLNPHHLEQEMSNIWIKLGMLKFAPLRVRDGSLSSIFEMP